MKKRPDLSGTARCADCEKRAEYPTPGDPESGPLVIRHTLDCPNRHVPVEVLATPLADRVRQFLADHADDKGWSGTVRPFALAYEVFTAYLAYEDLFAHVADDRPADEVFTDRGHIVIHSNADTHAGHRSVAFMDLGPVLHLWSGQGASLTPQLARELGKALVAWADRKNPPPFDLMVTLTGDALDFLGVEGASTIRLAVDQGTFKIAADNGTWSPPLTDGVLIQEGHDIP